MRALIIFILLFLAHPVLSYNPIVAEPDEAYEIIQIEGDPYVEHSYLGDLEDFPDMYEFSTDVAIDLRLKLSQRANEEAVPFGLIIVRQNEADGGVTEVVRQNAPLEEWKEKRNNMLGITFLEGEEIYKNITPGTYKVEVSTPDNKGSYMLTIGEEPVSTGYFKTLLNIFTTQRHFGFTPIHLLFSTYVYYLLGVVVLVYGWYRFRTFKKRNL